MHFNHVIYKTLWALTSLLLFTSGASAMEKEIYLPGTGEIYKVEVVPRQPASVIYYGGDILTMDGDVPSYAEAVVTQGKKIVFVGDKKAAIKKFGSNARLIDLKGNTMLPGFLDPHSHFMSAVRMVNQVNVAAPPVGTATSIPQIIEKLKAFQEEKHIAEDGWIIGWGYDQDLIEEKRHITKKDLDAAFPKRKVMLIHVSMHGAVLNSQALKWAGIDANTKTPAGGVIARMPGSNEPAGLLMEMAYIPVFAKLPQPSEEEMLDLTKPAQMMYASNGYTQAIEGFSHAEDLDFLMKAAAQERLFLDILALPGFTEMDKWFGNPKYKFGEYHNHLKLQACKITIDGSPQGKTALVSHPYHGGGPAGQKDWKGESSITQAQLDAITRKMFDANIPLHVHANGDGAIDMMIKTIEAAGISAKDDRRTVIVHSQFQRPEHLPKYVELGLTPSYFTLHTFYWGDVHVKNIGKEAAFFISPMKAAKAAGLVMSNHTDFNVTPLDPFWVIWSAMARESRSGQIIGPDQRVDAYTALQALTTGPAWQVFEEDRKGKIREGMLADFVVIKNNPVKQKVSEIKDNEVLATVKEGKVIYKKIGI
ncbi:amidohydrolase [Thiolapillus brandeum]|uniref:Metal-dependent hydrolase n=1 Tax=Thiolapillus brandeum TaxID=1076588 RepID=A0A7U6GJK3_9GAMM|nr:amidohydrolase [Thiolapillus brandeum]BAO44883.1 metal-dependent hydrolase [Thiolapillus brandeum]